MSPATNQPLKGGTTTTAMKNDSTTTATTVTSATTNNNTRTIYDRNDSIDFDGLLSLSSGVDIIYDDIESATNKGHQYPIPSMIHSSSTHSATNHNNNSMVRMVADSMLASERDEDDDLDQNDDGDNAVAHRNQQQPQQQQNQQRQNVVGIVSEGDEDNNTISRINITASMNSNRNSIGSQFDDEDMFAMDPMYESYNAPATGSAAHDDTSSYHDYTYDDDPSAAEYRPSSSAIPIPKKDNTYFDQQQHQPHQQQRQHECSISNSQPNSHGSSESNFLSSIMDGPKTTPQQAATSTNYVGIKNNEDPQQQQQHSSTNTTSATVAPSNTNKSSSLLSHTPPLLPTSYETNHFGKRYRSGSISRRLRSASEFLQEKSNAAAAAANTSNGIRTAPITAATSTIMKDLIIAEDTELHNALDQYEVYNDPSALEEMITSGALQNRLPPDLDLLGDLDLDFLSMDDHPGAANKSASRNQQQRHAHQPKNDDESTIPGIDDGASILLGIRKSSNASSYSHLVSGQYSKSQSGEHDDGIGELDFADEFVSDQTDYNNSSSSQQQFSSYNQGSKQQQPHQYQYHNQPQHSTYPSTTQQQSNDDTSTIGSHGILQMSRRRLSTDPINNNSDDDDSNISSGRTSPQSLLSHDDFFVDGRYRSNSLFSALLGDSSHRRGPTTRSQSTRFESFGSWLEASGNAGPVVSTSVPPALVTSTTKSSGTATALPGPSPPKGADATSRNVKSAVMPIDGDPTSNDGDPTSNDGKKNNESQEEEIIPFKTTKLKRRNKRTTVDGKTNDNQVVDSPPPVYTPPPPLVLTPPPPTLTATAARQLEAEKKRQERLEKREAKEREKELLRLQKLEEKEQKKKEKLEQKLLKDLEKKQTKKEAKEKAEGGKKSTPKEKKKKGATATSDMDVDDDVGDPDDEMTPSTPPSVPYQHISGSGRPRSLSDPNLRTTIDEATGLVQVDRPDGWIGAYSPDSRKVRIEKFLSKRGHRVWIKTVKYDVRKNFADSRLRVKGRFVKKEDELLMRELMSLT